MDSLQPSSGRSVQPWTWILIAALLVALAFDLTRSFQRDGGGRDRTGPGTVSSIDLARLHFGMSPEGALAALGDPQGKRSVRVGRECWRYRVVEGGFARLCFAGPRLVSTQQTSARVATRG